VRLRYDRTAGVADQKAHLLRTDALALLSEGEVEVDVEGVVRV
jgi:hypothetical protein